MKNIEVKMKELIPLIEESLCRGQSVRFNPKGVSMLPMLRPGIDGVILSPIKENLKKYDLPLYKSAYGTYLLHRIVEIKEDGYSCLGDNLFVRENGIQQEQMIAVVTAFYRGNKRHEVDEIGYQIYCRIWFHSRKFRYIYLRLKRKLKRMLRVKRSIKNV